MTGDGSPILKKAPKGGELEVKVVGPEGKKTKAAEAAGDGSEDLKAELEEAQARARAAETKIKAMQEAAAAKSPRRRSPSPRSSLQVQEVLGRSGQEAFP